MYKRQLRVTDVDGVIDYTALENYVSQLSRGLLFGSAVMAFNIVDIERIFRSASAFDFKSLVIDVSEAITFCLKRSQFLVAYAGNGTFVCILGGGDKTPVEVLEQELRDIIASMELCYSDGRPIIFSMVASSPIGLTFRTGQDVVSALSQAARSAQFKAEDMVPVPEKSFLNLFAERAAG